MVYSPYRGGRFRVSSPYGWRYLSSGKELHKGIDLVGADDDKTVCAVIGGVVIRSRIVYTHADLTWQWGNYVSVLDDDGRTIYYCHLDSRAVNQGDRVKAGDRIGVQGNTGYSFGAHLHFELRDSSGNSLNPASYLGIQNVAGSRIYTLPTAEPDYASLVCEKCGLEQQTKDYLNQYKYASDLWRKLYQQMS